MTEKEKMLLGKLYNASDAELQKELKRCRKLTILFNNSTEEDIEYRSKLLKDLFGKVETIDGRLTKDSTDLSGFFVGLKNASGNFSDTEELTNYTIDSTLKW